MLVATQAIGEGLLGLSRAAMAAFTIGLLVTFLGVRINTRLIRAKVKWWFHDIESQGGLHVHHMVIGVVLMVVAGITLIAALPQGLYLQLAALVFGAGVALTLDEFALILRLKDVYWSTEGRLSVDAVIVAVCAGMLLVLGIYPLGNLSTAGLTGVQGGVVIAVTIVAISTSSASPMTTATLLSAVAVNINVVHRRTNVEAIIYKRWSSRISAAIALVAAWSSTT